MLELVSATRLSEEAFWSSSALGRSLQRLSGVERIVPYLMYENRLGLPLIFNSRIQSGDGHDVIVFIHDDVWLDDFFLVERVLEGLARYDVVGIAGNRRRVRHQRSWALLDAGTFDDETNLSGIVGHGAEPFGDLSIYGAVPAECELLDGVLLATRKSTLNASGVLFDRRFDFHFYDLDFCRSCRAAGLRLGTWPIAVTHQSRGNLVSDPWRRSYREYLSKWPD